MLKKLIKIISILVTTTTVATFSVFAQNVSFSDLPTYHWAYNSINTLVTCGILNGYSDNTFRPEKNVTRAEWAKILFTLSGRSTEGINVHLSLENCGDLNKRHWASIYMVGMSDVLPPTLIEPPAKDEGTYYYPERAATREEVAISLVKLRGLYDKNIDTSILNNYVDQDNIGSEKKKYIAAAVKNGIISGYDDNTLRIQNQVTRAEASELAYNAFKN